MDPPRDNLERRVFWIMENADHSMLLETSSADHYNPSPSHKRSRIIFPKIYPIDGCSHRFTKGQQHYSSNTTSKKKAFETLLVPARSRSRNGKSLGGSSRQEIGSVSQHVTVSHKQATNAVKEKESSDSGIRERKRPTTIMVRLLSLFSLRLLL